MIESLVTGGIVLSALAYLLYRFLPRKRSSCAACPVGRKG